MKLTISFLSILLPVFFNTQPVMAGDVTCLNGVCLNYGWDFTSSQGVYTARCINNDCYNVGWINGDPLGNTTVVACAVGSCFVNGWTETQNFYPFLRSVTTCKNNNCLKVGWTTYANGFPVSDVICAINGCDVDGWITRTYYPTPSTSQIVCKPGGCYIDGWTTTP